MTYQRLSSSSTGLPDKADSCCGACGTCEKPDSGSVGALLVLADTLRDYAVINTEKETLGEVSGIMLDVQNGLIAYAVLSTGGLLGIGERLFVVPWAVLKLDRTHECFVLDVSKERLKDAPEFDKDRWPDVPDAKWVDEVHSFYCAHPYKK